MNMNEIIEALSKMATPKYVKNYENYQEGDFIQYSGQVWDDKEILAMIDTILNGNWIVSGENVNKFQRLFSKKFNVGKIEWFCLGSIFVWSNSIIYAMFVIIILVLAMLLSDFKKYHKNAPFFIFPSLIFPFICKVSPWAESFNRRFFNIGGLVFLILITIPYLSRKDIEIERIFKSLTF